MKRRIRLSSLLLCLASPVALAQVAGEEAPPLVDPAAIAALDEMGAFLRSQQSMHVRSVSDTDEILESGQKIQLRQTADLRLQRPDHLRLDVSSDRKTRQFFYDGETLTLYGPRTGYYATVDAPPTVSELADEVSERYGIDLPLRDLFLWGTAESPVAEVVSAQYIGPATLNGKLCDQYALRQQDLDWQVWIARGAEPLPMKMVLTTATEPEQPQHVVELAWTLGPRFEDDVFTFVPPPGSHRIDLVPLDAGDKRASR